MKLHLKIVHFLLLVLLLLFTHFAYSIKYPKLDSLERALARSKGIDRVTTLMELGNRYIKGIYQRPDPAIAREFYLKAATVAIKLGYVKGIAEAKIEIAHAEYLEQHYDSAIAYAQAALELDIKTNDTTGLIYCYYWIGISELYLNHYKIAFGSMMKAHELADLSRKLDNLVIVTITLAEFYNRFGIFGKEKEYLLECASLEIKQKKNPAMSYYQLGRFLVFHGYYGEAIRYFRMADSSFRLLKPTFILEERPVGFLEAKQLGSIARAFHFWGYNDSALIYHRKSLEKFAHCGFNFVNVDVANQWEGIGLVYTFLGVYDSARYYFDRSMEFRNNLEDWLGVGACFDGLGQLSWLLGNHNEAVQYFNDALSVKEKAKIKAINYLYPQRMISYKEGSSNTHLFLGKVYSEWGFTETALREFTISLQLCREIGFISGQTDALIEIGKMYGKTGHYEMARQMLGEAIELCTRAGDLPGQAIVLRNEGDLCFERKEYRVALDYFKKSEKLQNIIKNPAEQAELDILIGKTLVSMNIMDEAFSYLSHAITLAEQLRLQKAHMDGHFAMANLLERSGHIGDALEHFKNGLELKEALYRQKTTSYLADIDSHNRADRNALQILLLSKKKQIKEIKLNRLRTEISGLAGLVLLVVLFFMILASFLRIKREHHSVLLQLKLLRTQLNPGLIFSAVNDIGEFVRRSDTDTAVTYLSSFSRFLQAVLHGTREEYITFEKEIILVKNYMNFQLISHPGRFSFEVSTSDQDDTMDFSIPPFLVFPFIENAVRKVLFRNARDGKIRVSYIVDGNVLMVTVEHSWKETEMDSFGTGSPDMIQEKEVELIRQRLAYLGKKFNRKTGIEIVVHHEDPGTPAVNQVRMAIPVFIT